MMKKIFVCLFLISVMVISFNTGIYSQTVYEPLHRDVYNYLERLSQKGVIEFNDLIRPVPRKYIAEKLIELSDNLSKLTSLEKEELIYFRKDFLNEIDLIIDRKIPENNPVIFGKDFAGRYRLFSYADNFFKVNVSPILGGKFGKSDDDNQSHIWNGVYIYGYIGDKVGFSFDFRDNLEKGNKLDKFREFSPLPGINPRTNFNLLGYPENKIEYSDIKTTISYDWNWGTITAGKDQVEWGYEENGKLVMSQRAPSFPFFRLDIRPVEWLRFNYFHGWLQSDLIDSSSITFTPEGNIHYLFREKFIASHTLTLTPFKGLDISLGESIIYSDRLEVSYLFPLMFFRLADHHLSRQINNAGANAQFFANVSSRNHLPNTHLYGTIFIDEITLSGLFDSYKQRNQFGFSLGGSVTDLPIDNLTVTAEFTKIYPFVYSHFNNAHTYKSQIYVLGHWMGHNSDQVYVSLNYRILRGLQTKIWSRYIRKGEDGNVELQYDIQPQPPFLFGLRKNYTYLGGEVSYEIVHELTAKVYFESRLASLQNADLSFTDKRVNDFYFSVYYGL